MTYEQINYYYDTYDQKLRRSNITARIRKKNGKLTATIKEHSNGTTHSKETSFHVDSVSKGLSYNGEKLYLYGEMHTKRTEIDICDGVKLMLDYNQYLDTEDYEVELEYEPRSYDDAIGFIGYLQSKLNRDELLIPSEPKSNRFYKSFFKSDRI